MSDIRVKNQEEALALATELQKKVVACHDEIESFINIAKQLDGLDSNAQYIIKDSEQISTGVGEAVESAAKALRILTEKFENLNTANNSYQGMEG